MTKPPEPVVTGELKVTQADREAAWPFRNRGVSGGDIRGWRAGNYDTDNAIKAFARHRQAHSLPGDVGMRAALEQCLTLIDDMSRFVGQMALKDYALFNEAPINGRRALAALTPSALSGDAGEETDGFEAECDDDTYTIRFPDGHALTAWADGRLFVSNATAGFAPFETNVAALPSHQGAGEP